MLREEIMRVLAVVLLGTALFGCTATQKAQFAETVKPFSRLHPSKLTTASERAVKTESSYGSTVVALYRMPATKVLLTDNVQSLRTVVAAAHDQGGANGAMITAFAINQVSRSEPALVAALTKADMGFSIYADEEWILLTRGNTLFFAPAAMVNSTPIGSIQVSSLDKVGSYPLAHICAYLAEFEFEGPTTLVSSHFSQIEFELKGKTNASLLHNLKNVSSTLQFASGQLPPNVCLVSHDIGGAKLHFCLPYVVDGITSELMSPAVGRLISMQIPINGAHVGLVRAEEIPVVLAGLISGRQ